MADVNSRTEPDVAEVRARRFVVTDEAGFERICLTADGDVCTIRMLDRDGFQRIALTARPDAGALAVSSRSPEQPTRVDVFALDAEHEDDAPTVGAELVDRGNSVGGLTVRGGNEARAWTRPLI